MAPPPTREGEVPYAALNAGKPCKTWYKVYGEPSTYAGPTLIALHGGPGAGHQYLHPLIDLYEQHGLPIVFYDQLGCGNSTRLREKMSDTSFWTFDLFIHELDNLVDHLGLREKGFYVLGQSWGGMLAGAYASRRPHGLKKAILSSGPASIPLMAEGARHLLSQLPEPERSTLEECERKGDFESEEFENASKAFFARYVCRIDPYPDDLIAAFANLKEDPTVYMTMQGPSEFYITGSYKNWEGWREAHNIEVETLIINGRYDEVAEPSIRPWFKHINKVKWVTLENSSHMSHFEERERYMEAVAEFLLN